MYFVPEQAHRVFQRLQHCLVDGGLLACSPVESIYMSRTDLSPAKIPGAALYRKEAPAVASAEAATDLPPIQRTYACGNEKVPAPHKFAPQTRRQPEYDEARRHYEGCRFKDAAEILAELLQTNPCDGRAMTLLAKTLADQGRLTEALSWCDKSIAADKLDVSRHFLRATILQELGDFDQAAQSLRHVQFLDPKFVLAYVSLGSLARKQCDAAAARKHFSRALQLLADYPADAGVTEFEGVTARRMREIVAAMNSDEVRS
jgi:chemotaxis protein methyltransferase CheR